MITFRPYSVPVSHQRFGHQKPASKPVYLYIPVNPLNNGQKKVLADLERLKIITDAKRMAEVPELVRVTVAEGQDVKKLITELGDIHSIAVIADGDRGFNHFEAMTPTVEYAFAT